MPIHGGNKKDRKKKKKKEMKKSLDCYLVLDLQKSDVQVGRLVFEGVTTEADGHAHRYFVQVDNGRLTGHTDSVNGHSHIFEARVFPGMEQSLSSQLNLSDNAEQVEASSKLVNERNQNGTGAFHSDANFGPFGVPHTHMITIRV